MLPLCESWVRVSPCGTNFRASESKGNVKLRESGTFFFFFFVEEGGKIADSQVFRDLKNTFIIKILNQRTYICFDKLFWDYSTLA